jgi:hypothetical protein
MGKSTSPSPEVMFYLLGREFSVLPSVIAELPVHEMMQMWSLFAELQPKDMGNGK